MLMLTVLCIACKSVSVINWSVSVTNWSVKPRIFFFFLAVPIFGYSSIKTDLVRDKQLSNSFIPSFNCLGLQLRQVS